jgi:hypothetical protein
VPDEIRPDEPGATCDEKKHGWTIDH